MSDWKQRQVEALTGVNAIAFSRPIPPSDADPRPGPPPSLTTEEHRGPEEPRRGAKN